MKRTHKGKSYCATSPVKTVNWTKPVSSSCPSTSKVHHGMDGHRHTHAPIFFFFLRKYSQAEWHTSLFPALGVSSRLVKFSCQVLGQPGLYSETLPQIPRMQLSWQSACLA